VKTVLLLDPEKAAEIAGYLRRHAQGLLVENFHMTDREEAAGLMAYAHALLPKSAGGSAREGLALPNYDGDVPFDYEATFSVEGSSPFPMDLLRQFCCVPASSADADRIERSMHSSLPQRVALRRLAVWSGTEVFGTVMVNSGAFAERGWSVIGDGR
jgi:hypothetical protein